MIKQLGDWFTQPALAAARVPVAAALLMLEGLRSTSDDNKVAKKLRTRLKKQVANWDKDSKGLVLVAWQALEAESPDLEMNALINERFSYEDKFALLISLWQIAFADGLIDPLEDALIRDASQRLQLDQSDFIRAKHRARAG